jgi:hypothetical protein
MGRKALKKRGLVVRWELADGYEYKYANWREHECQFISTHRLGVAQNLSVLYNGIELIESNAVPQTCRAHTNGCCDCEEIDVTISMDDVVAFVFDKCITNDGRFMSSQQRKINEALRELGTHATMLTYYIERESENARYNAKWFDAARIIWAAQTQRDEFPVAVVDTDGQARLTIISPRRAVQLLWKPRCTLLMLRGRVPLPLDPLRLPPIARPKEEEFTCP